MRNKRITKTTEKNRQAEVLRRDEPSNVRESSGSRADDFFGRREGRGKRGRRKKTELGESVRWVLLFDGVLDNESKQRS